MYDKCYFCLDQLPKLKKESTASFFVNFGGAGVQKSRPTLLFFISIVSSFKLIHPIWKREKNDQKLTLKVNKKVPKNIIWQISVVLAVTLSAF